jgi:hypothetical protein
MRYVMYRWVVGWRFCTAGVMVLLWCCSLLAGLIIEVTFTDAAVAQPARPPEKKVASPIIEVTFNDGATKKGTYEGIGSRSTTNPSHVIGENAQGGRVVIPVTRVSSIKGPGQKEVVVELKDGATFRLTKFFGGIRNRYLHYDDNGNVEVELEKVKAIRFPVYRRETPRGQ